MRCRYCFVVCCFLCLLDSAVVDGPVAVACACAAFLLPKHPTTAVTRTHQRKRQGERRIRADNSAITMSSSFRGEIGEVANDHDDDVGDYRSVVDDFGCEAIEKYLVGERFSEVDEDGDDDEDFHWIRLQKGPDECLREVRDRASVFEMIGKIKDVQRQYGPCELYPRHWEPISAEDCKEGEGDNILVPVNGEPVNGLGPEGQEFSVMQFNTLAEGLSSAPDAKKPFKVDPAVDARAQTEKTEGFGGFLKIPFPHVTLDFSLRRWRLIEVLLRSARDGCLMDLIAMEEIDHYRGFFAPILRLFGYEGVFAPKLRSPGVRTGWYSDGCCLFWRSETFELVSKRRLKFNVGSQVYIVAVLRHKASGRLIVTVVTHLKASESNEQIRCSQVEELLQAVANTSLEVRERRGENEISVLILGDFNTDGEAIRNVLNFELQTTTECNDGDRNGKASSAILSAYPISPPGDSLYTTWKIRRSEVRRIIDYIFYSNFKCTATLQVPPETELEPTKLPGLKYPSDHMMIAAKFRIS